MIHPTLIKFLCSINAIRTHATVKLLRSSRTRADVQMAVSDPPPALDDGSADSFLNFKRLQRENLLALADKLVDKAALR